jgi:hypothetical protein
MPRLLADPARSDGGREQYFAAEVDATGANVNYGVFLVAGQASGLYARVQVGATDARAKSAPALVGATSRRSSRRVARVSCSQPAARATAQGRFIQSTVALVSRKLSASLPRTVPVLASILSAACSSPRTGPRFTMAIHVPRSAARRRNR